jgi:hypothetical protein
VVRLLLLLFHCSNPPNHAQSTVFGDKFRPPLITNEGRPPLRMSRKEGEEFAEEYYLRRTLTNSISFEEPPRVLSPPVVSGSTNTGTVRDCTSRSFIDYFENTPEPRPLHITVDMLAIVLRKLALENEISAVHFFHILEMELRERGILPDVVGASIVFTSTAGTQSHTQKAMFPKALPSLSAHPQRN